MLDDFLQRVALTLFDFKPIDATKSGHVLIFCTICAIMGELAVLFDLCLWIIFKRSFLKLRHKLRYTVLILFFWPFASALMGFFALIIQVLQPTLLGALTAGISWNFLAASLAKLGAQEDDDLDVDGANQ